MPGPPLLIKDLTARTAYRIFLPKNVSKPRCISKYNEWNLSPSNWKQVWQNQLLWRFVRSVQDTNYLIAHTVLPTKDRLLRFGMKVSPFCHCGAFESLTHLFLDCPFANKFLVWFNQLIKQYKPTWTTTSRSENLLGISSHYRLPVAFNALLGIIRHRVWLVRNSSTFDDTRPNFDDALVKVKSTFRFLLVIEQRNTKEDYFVSSWLAGNFFGQLATNNTQIMFNSNIT